MDVKWTSEQKKVIDLRDRDILANVCGNGSRDVRKIMNSLGIHKGDPSKLTYGQLLKQCNII